MIPWGAVGGGLLQTGSPHPHEGVRVAADEDSGAHLGAAGCRKGR